MHINRRWPPPTSTDDELDMCVNSCNSLYPFPSKYPYTDGMSSTPRYICGVGFIDAVGYRDNAYTHVDEKCDLDDGGGAKRDILWNSLTCGVLILVTIFASGPGGISLSVKIS